MQVSFWYSSEEKLPDRNGFYLACEILENHQLANKRYTAMGYYYWDGTSWQRMTNPNKIQTEDEGPPFVAYWTFSDPYIWYEFDYPKGFTLTPAESAALQEIRDATDRFNTLQKLCQQSKLD